MRCKGIAKGTRVERRDGDGIVALDAIFGSEFEPNGGIATDFVNRAIESEQLFGGDQDFFLVEQTQSGGLPGAARRLAKALVPRAFAEACRKLGSDSSWPVLNKS